MKNVHNLRVFSSVGLELGFNARNHPCVLLCNKLHEQGCEVRLFLKPQDVSSNPSLNEIAHEGVKISCPSGLSQRLSVPVNCFLKAALILDESINSRCSLRESRRRVAADDFHFFNYWTLKRLLSAYADLEAPNILHVFGPNKWTCKAIEWAHTAGLPVVYTELGSLDPNISGYTVLRRYINRCSTVVLPSEMLYERLRFLGYSGKVEIIPFGVPDPGPSRNAKRHDGEVVIGMAARLHMSKGQQCVVRAFAELRNRYPELKLRTILAGDGPARHIFSEHAKQLGVFQYVEFPGAFYCPKGLEQFMNSIDIFVLPTVTEGQPVSIVEALCYGKPVIATKVSSIPDLLSNDNGVLINPGSVGELTGALSVLIKDKKLREDMGRKGRELYERRHKLENAVMKYISIYSELCE